LPQITSRYPIQLIQAPHSPKQTYPIHNPTLTPPSQASFYWILETSRRRLIHLTLLLITGFLAIGSEILQALLPNDRDFDPYDILANVVGSAIALAACSWYHRRMLERRRRNKHYDAVPGDELADGEEGERDLELGEGVGVSQQETGRLDASDVQAGEGAKRTATVSEELDNWDENVEDEWEEADADTTAAATDGPSKAAKRAE
jgi:hypothetical protein